MYLTWQALGTDVYLLCAIGLCEEIGVQASLVCYGKLIVSISNLLQMVHFHNTVSFNSE